MLVARGGLQSSDDLRLLLNFRGHIHSCDTAGMCRRPVIADTGTEMVSAPWVGFQSLSDCNAWASRYLL